MSHTFSASAPVFIPNGANSSPISFSPSSNSPFEASPDAYSFFGIHPFEGGPRIVEQQVKSVEEQPKKMLTFRDLEKMLDEEKDSRRQKSVSPKTRLTRRDLERMQREEEDDEQYYQEFQRKHREMGRGSPVSSYFPVQMTHYHESSYNSEVTVGPISVQQLMSAFRGYH